VVVDNRPQPVDNWAGGVDNYQLVAHPLALLPSAASARPHGPSPAPGAVHQCAGRPVGTVLCLSTMPAEARGATWRAGRAGPPPVAARGLPRGSYPHGGEAYDGYGDCWPV